MKYSIVTSACIVHPDSLKKSETPHKHLHGGDVNQEFFSNTKTICSSGPHELFKISVFFFKKHQKVNVLSDVLN